MKSTRASGVEVAKKRVRNKPQARTKMTREDKKERAKVCLISFPLFPCLSLSETIVSFTFTPVNS